MSAIIIICLSDLILAKINHGRKLLVLPGSIQCSDHFSYIFRVGSYIYSTCVIGYIRVSTQGDSLEVKPYIKSGSNSVFARLFFYFFLLYFKLQASLCGLLEIWS